MKTNRKVETKCKMYYYLVYSLILHNTFKSVFVVKMSSM